MFSILEINWTDYKGINVISYSEKGVNEYGEQEVSSLLGFMIFEDDIVFNVLFHCIVVPL